MDGWIEGWIGTVAWIDGWIDRCHMYVCMYSIPVSEIVIPLLKLLVQPDKDLFIYNYMHLLFHWFLRGTDR